MVNPVTMNPAVYMCAHCGQVDGPNIASIGWASITRPSASIVNPVGLFIQAFAEMTKNAPARLETIIGIPLSMCALGDIRSQPKR